MREVVTIGGKYRDISKYQHVVVVDTLAFSVFGDETIVVYSNPRASNVSTKWYMTVSEFLDNFEEI